MTPEVWSEVSSCLDRLMDLDPPAAETFLRRLREERPEVAAEVESLWRQTTVAPHFHTPPTVLPADAAAVEPPQTATAGGYELGGEIARGGMGAVYQAHDPSVGRTLAVKVLLPNLRQHPEAQARFLREAQITGRLQHPGIPPLHELGRLPDGTPYFAMKLIRGRTLAAMLLDGPPDRGEAVATFEQICRTLAYAHSQGVIHRDLKPSNVMVGAFGEVQVMDWGLARQLRIADCGLPNRDGDGVAGELPAEHVPQSAIRNPQLTQAGDVRGTPAFMAPEQARGDPDLDERCDVFGLGGILAALLTRQPTFTGSSEQMLRQAAAGAVGPALQRVEAAGEDADLLAVARRCLAPQREDRFRHAGEVADAVTAYRASARRRLEAAEVARRTAETQTREERRRRRLVIGFGASLLAAVSVGLGLVGWFWLMAEERRTKAETAERRVTDEQARTEETAAHARKAIKDGFIVATEHPEFRKHGMQEARKLLLDRALAFYREFTELRKDDPALRQEVADAHGRIAAILADRGNLTDALAAYAQAIQLTRRLKDDQPGETRFAVRLAGLLLEQACAEQALGRGADAGESLRQARGELDPLLAAEPDNPEWAHLDARILSEHGRWLYAHGKLDESAAADQQAIDKLTRLAEGGKFNPAKVADTAVVALVGLGHVRKDQRRPADALALYNRAAARLEEQYKAAPGPYAMSELARLHGSIALVQDNLGKKDDAVASHRAAIRLREQLVALNPAVPEYRYDLSLSLLNLADDLGKTDEARATLDRAGGLTAELVREFPDQMQYRHQAAFVRFAQANAARQDPKQVAKAEGLLADALKHLDEIERRKAMTPLFRKTLAMWETEAGQVERMQERYAAAVKHFEAAEGIYRSLIDEKFEVENCRFAVARQQMSFAYAAGMTGDFEKAMAVQYVGVEQLTELLKLREDDRQFQQSLGRATENMVSLGNDCLQRDVPLPKREGVDEWVRYNQTRLARWRAWEKQYPAVGGFRRQAVEQAVWIAAQYAAQLDPAKKLTDEERKGYLSKTVEALAQAREVGLTDAKPVEANPGLAHFRKLPEYQEFLKTLK